ncbi:PQQ-binding-like beta-propeller repeat protein, partial [bacterium]|nr:PQQ-binding-like beta-propeller repeat protein [bacterium]
LCCCLMISLAHTAWSGEPDVLAKFVTETCGVSGGLCVQVGSADMALAMGLARTGRFLVQAFDDDPKAVAAAQKAIQAEKLYGLATVEHTRTSKKLPYTENLVNVLIVRGKTPAAEIVRVLCPGGVVLMKAGGALPAGFTAVQAEAGWLAGRKPWPAEMDGWTHPRHGADGNAVGKDRLAGPPRRVRWVTGPDREVGTMVSTEGRNFYGAAWARDSFNGLPLWRRDLKPAQKRQGYGYRLNQSWPRPVAAGKLLYAVTAETVVALDGATGKEVRRFPEGGKPFELLHVDGSLVTVDAESVRALDAATGKLRWTHKAQAPRYVVATKQSVFLMENLAERGVKPVALCLDLASGKARWKLAEPAWLPKVRRIVAHGDLVAYEVSTLSDTKEGNALHIVSATDGVPMWHRTFVPSMNHMKQARALFVGDTLWVVENRKCIALDPRTGKEQQSYPAGLCHCFPPVATVRYVFSGEMELTDLEGGAFDAHRITKSACGRDLGLMPANGLIYVTPKHCVCWPMLRGYAAMAPARPTPLPAATPPVAEKGTAAPAKLDAPGDGDWPCYRKDGWRSSCSPAAVPVDLKPVWSADLSQKLDGPIADEWRENPFTRGPVTPPVAAYGIVCVARPDQHEVIALDPKTGGVRWRFTANGRVDTAPTLHRGLCLFGTRNGWVYCLRADDGQLVWRLRSGPVDERIVAYGQVESPWPVAGSVLVVDDVAYFAAGRQPLADGGIHVCAVVPATGAVRWTQRLDTIPTKNFYGSSGLEYDPFDLLHREGKTVAMS